MNPEVFLEHSRHTSRQKSNRSELTELRRFKALFGVSPLVCTVLWNKIGRSKPKKSSPTHLLWALLFLRVYSNEHTNRALTGVDEKTFRTWAWRFVCAISKLNVVSSISF